MQKKIVVSVTNDLATDQRVGKVAQLLHHLNFEVVVIGRKLPGSLPINRPYRCVRFRLPFRKGALFYVSYQLRLMWFLLFERADVLLANDLDTLLPNFIASKLKRVPLVYDTHEYFCGVPELQNRPFVRGVWHAVERFVFPRLKHVFTVNQSIANLYHAEYGVMPQVFRNIGPRIVQQTWKTRRDLNLPEDQFICINQGTGINTDRGMEEALEAIIQLEGVLLLLVGDGDVVPQLKALVETRNLAHKVRFVPKMPYHEMLHYTHNANCGLSLDKPTNTNYKLSLPNKIFDYIQCGIPIIASNLPEVATIVKGHNVGLIVANHHTATLKTAITEMRQLVTKRVFDEPLQQAASQLHWEAEAVALTHFYAGLEMGKP